MFKPFSLTISLLSIGLLFGQNNAPIPYHRIVKKTEKTLAKTQKRWVKNAVATKQNKSPLRLQTQEFSEANRLNLPHTPQEYWKQEWLATMNPELGRPTPEILYEEIARQQSSLERRAMPGTTKTSWIARGPNQVAGRTRALAVDPTVTSGKKVWAGAVTGGLWYNDDITNASSSWKFISSLWSNITVTCIAFDPNAPGTMYIGTGEGWGSTSSGSRGFGIFKSIDSGKTFTNLAASKSYFFVNDLLVRSESGKSVLYCATDMQFLNGAWHGTAAAGLMRSTNGGISFTNVMPKIPGYTTTMVPADLELGADNRLWVGSRRNYAQAATDKGGGRILYTDDGVNFTTAYSHADKAGRVEIACAPNSAQTIYGVFESNGKVDTLIKSLNRGASWSAMKKPKDADVGIPATDPSRGQAWYDLILAVSPKDSSDVIFGAIDLFLSENSGASFAQIGKWSNNSGLANLSCSFVHADQHNVVFIPGTNSCIIGNDGGIYYAPDILDNLSNQSVIYRRNNGYLVTQFYWGDLSQTKGKDLMLAGAQDNGTHQLKTSGIANENMVSGGDGGFCFISQTNDNKQVVSYVYNQFFSTTDNWGNASKLLDDATTGKFINPAVWDDLNGFLFAGKGKCTIYRNKIGSAAAVAQTLTISGTAANGAPSAFCSSVSALGKTQLYVGTDVGKLYVTNDASVTTPTWTDITATLNAGNISAIHRLRRSDTMFVTISNYGTGFNIYMSLNGGKNWTSRDGNIFDMPIWDILLNPRKMGEAVIATELGIYGTSDIFATNVVWQPYNDGMGAVKVANLRYRDTDQTIMATTHGRGVFTSDAWSKSSPVVKFNTNIDTVCSHKEVQFLDSTSNSPTFWKWSFTPSSGIKYHKSTDSSSRNPLVQFTKGGNYSVTLLASNGIGEDQKTMINRIFVIDSIPVSMSIVSNPTIVCVNDTFNIVSSLKGNVKLIDFTYTWKKNGASVGGNASSLYGLTVNVEDKYQLSAVSKTACVLPEPLVSNIFSLTTKGIKILTVSCNLDTLKALNVGSGTFSWYRSGVFVGSGRNFKPTQTGLFRCVYDENGCKSDSSALIVLKSLGADAFAKVLVAKIYPNPANSLVSIDCNFSGKAVIYNAVGNSVKWNLPLLVGGNAISLDGLVSGMYMIELFNDFDQIVLRKQLVVE